MSSTSTSWTPQSPTEKELVSSQLERLLIHPAFRNSKRCVSLLRYVVNQRLEGNTQSLKERALGIEVFGRDPNYDTSSEPIVRSAAGEIRKRIAQYYHEPGHGAEIRIELPPGSYLPEFHPAPENGHLPVTPSVPEIAAPAPVKEEREVVGQKKLYFVIGACLLVAIGALIFWRGMFNGQSSLDRFWGPGLASRGGILLCVGTEKNWGDSADASSNAANGLHFQNMLPITDAVAFSHITSFLAETHTPYRVQSARSTTLNDLTKGPVVFIGAFNNSWTLQTTDPLRFHFVQPQPRSTGWIADRKNPSQQYIGQYGGTSADARDYAIVAKFFASADGQVAFVAAGLGAAGTSVASDLLTDPRYMQSFTAQLPKGWESKNIEAVISAQVIGDKPGFPHVEAIDVW